MRDGAVAQMNMEIVGPADRDPFRALWGRRPVEQFGHAHRTASSIAARITAIPATKSFKIDRLPRVMRAGRSAQAPLNAGIAHRFCRAKVQQQRLLPSWADEVDRIKLGDAERLTALGAVRADGETVRLIPQPLQIMQRRIIFR